MHTKQQISASNLALNSDDNYSGLTAIPNKPKKYAWNMTLCMCSRCLLMYNQQLGTDYLIRSTLSNPNPFLGFVKTYKAYCLELKWKPADRSRVKGYSFMATGTMVTCVKACKETWLYEDWTVPCCL